MKTKRGEHEIAHGMELAKRDAEAIWGWRTPAGKIRAARRGNLIAKAAGLAPGLSALEIGCGTGLFTEIFAKTGAEILAVDISPHLIELAERRNLPSDQVTYLVAKFEDCILYGPFDAIVGSSVLHHLELDESIKRIHELLKPGGKIAFAEPNLLNLQVFVQKKVPIIKKALGDSPDETAFSRWHIRRVLLRCGFDRICVTPIDWLHPYTPRPFIPMISAIGRVLEGLPLLRELSGSQLIVARKPPLGKDCHNPTPHTLEK